MIIFRFLCCAMFSSLLASCSSEFAHHKTPVSNPQFFRVHGVIKELRPADGTVIIRHEAIPHYMAAMTMPFKVKDSGEFVGLRVGEAISFRLLVAKEESWIDQIHRIGSPKGGTPSEFRVPPLGGPAGLTNSPTQQNSDRHPLLDYKFTNELGKAVSLGQFKGQALAITFFFTRCPIPDFCPRLSKNFEEASRKLTALADAPTNWHFLSVSFDTEFDTPAVLREYAQRYHYDPARWSFLTGPKEKITELARLSEVTVEPDGALFNHNFRTLVIDAAGQLQMSFPVGGNLSDALVGEILKAAAHQ